jgi:hypothetical protein
MMHDLDGRLLVAAFFLFISVVLLRLAISTSSFFGGLGVYPLCCHTFASRHLESLDDLKKMFGYLARSIRTK